MTPEVRIWAPARAAHDEMMCQQQFVDATFISFWAALPIGTRVIYHDLASRPYPPFGGWEPERRRGVLKGRDVALEDGQLFLSVYLELEGATPA